MELVTAGEPARLRLTPDRSTIHADGQDLAFVTVEVTDGNGVLRPDATPPVKLAVSGPGTIIGVGNGDMTSLESYQANPHHAFEGRLLAVIRAGREAGTIRIDASAPGFPDAGAIVHCTALH